MHLALRSSPRTVPTPFLALDRAGSRIAAHLLVVLAALGTAACSDESPSDAGPRVQTVEVVPAAAWLEVGKTLALQSIARDEDGEPVTGADRKSTRLNSSH